MRHTTIDEERFQTRMKHDNLPRFKSWSFSHQNHPHDSSKIEETEDGHEETQEEEVGDATEDEEEDGEDGEDKTTRHHQDSFDPRLFHHPSRHQSSNWKHKRDMRMKSSNSYDVSRSNGIFSTEFPIMNIALPERTGSLTSLISGPSNLHLYKLCLSRTSVGSLDSSYLQKPSCECIHNRPKNSKFVLCEPS